MHTPPIGIAPQFLAGRAPRAEDSPPSKIETIEARLQALEKALSAAVKRIAKLEKEQAPAEPTPDVAAISARLFSQVAGGHNAA